MMTEWQLIETAPDDGSPVDLWVRSPVHYPKRLEWKVKYAKAGYRITDCTYDKVNYSWLKGGAWMTGRQYYNRTGALCFDPTDKSYEATVATHWMPTPGPPLEESGTL